MVSALSEDPLIETLLTVRASALSLVSAHAARLGRIPAERLPSAQNLLHYIGLRQHDLVDIQDQLAECGLSSLGRAEAHVLATLDAVLLRLGAKPPQPDAHSLGLSRHSSRDLLATHAAEALGQAHSDQRPRLMVTMPTEASHDRALVAELIDAGMDLARINCAHDGAAEWEAIAHNVREESMNAGRDVKIAFDLAGPKLRTGSLPAGRRVVKIKPERLDDGQVQRPASVRFVTPEPDREADETNTVPVGAELIHGAEPGDVVKLRDARRRKRTFVVTAVGSQWLEARCEKTTYFVSGGELRRARDGEVVATSIVGELPETETFIRLLRGDQARIQHGSAPGRAAELASDGSVVTPATISVELDAVFTSVEPGHRLLIDDGSIETVIDSVGDDFFDVSVIRPHRKKLKGEKGINLPDTMLQAPALTEDDLAALDTIVPIADLISLSFVRSAGDIADARQALAERGRPDLPLGIKIETAASFSALPDLLLQGLAQPPLVVMIARGDLAIEVGFDRLAEVQEEVLWLCEAAHVPVIWATQVAESMAKEGVPTRAEVTDAAWASRAECVMLNKGQYIGDAVTFVDSVLQRMQRHQRKQTPLLGKLSVSSTFS